MLFVDSDRLVFLGTPTRDHGNCSRSSAVKVVRLWEESLISWGLHLWFLCAFSIWHFLRILIALATVFLSLIIVFVLCCLFYHMLELASLWATWMCSSVPRLLLSSAFFPLCHHVRTFSLLMSGYFASYKVRRSISRKPILLTITVVRWNWTTWFPDVSCTNNVLCIPAREVTKVKIKANNVPVNNWLGVSPRLFGPGHWKTMVEAENAVWKLFDSSVDFADLVIDLTVVDNEIILKDAPWELRDLMSENYRGPSVLQSVKQLFQTKSLSVSSAFRSVQKIIKKRWRHEYLMLVVGCLLRKSRRLMKQIAMCFKSRIQHLQIVCCVASVVFKTSSTPVIPWTWWRLTSMQLKRCWEVLRNMFVFLKIKFLSGEISYLEKMFLRLGRSTLSLCLNTKWLTNQLTSKNLLRYIQLTMVCLTSFVQHSLYITELHRSLSWRNSGSLRSC